MVPIKETVRIISILELCQALMTPVLVSIKCRQRLIIMSIVLVDMELIITRGISESVTPSADKIVNFLSDTVIFVGSDDFNDVFKVVAVGEGRVVVAERLHALYRERLDHDGRAVGGGVLLHKGFELVAELNPCCGIEGFGVESVQIVSWA